MALNDVTIIKGASGLGRPLAGEDHISGMVFWLTDANLPSGFGTSDRVKTFFEITDAENAGITEGSATNGVLWYHINEFFRIQPNGVLYVGIYGGVGGTVDFTDIELVQTYADGKIRQMGVFDTTTFATSAVTSLQASCDTLETNKQPLQVLYASDISGTADLSTLPDLRTLNSKNVSVIISEDGANDGAALAVTEGNSVTTLGATLGAVSLAKVNESIAWVEKFNMTSGTELNVPAMANGQIVKDLAPSLLDSLKTKGYVFMRKYIGNAGTFHEDTDTSIATSSDYATIENNRVADKAGRQVYTFMLPNLNRPVVVDDQGRLTEGTIQIFKNASDRALDQMAVDEEVSSFETIINPEQDVLSSGIVTIRINIVPVGVARKIEVTIGFVVQL